MKFAVKMVAVIEAPNEIAATRQAVEVGKLLGSSMLKTLLSGYGITLIGHHVEPKPTPTK